MEFKQFIYNLKGHFTTITRHRHEVMKNCFRAGIFWQGLMMICQNILHRNSG